MGEAVGSGPTGLHAPAPGPGLAQTAGMADSLQGAAVARPERRPRVHGDPCGRALRADVLPGHRGGIGLLRGERRAPPRGCPVPGPSCDWSGPGPRGRDGNSSSSGAAQGMPGAGDVVGCMGTGSPGHGPPALRAVLRLGKTLEGLGRAPARRRQ
eukprot:2607227-Lingulodinium_polyedra.AAC.1